MDKRSKRKRNWLLGTWWQKDWITWTSHWLQNLSPQVENVRLLVWSSGKRKASCGTLYLSATHTIFVENHPETRQETWVSSPVCMYDPAVSYDFVHCQNAASVVSSRDTWLWSSTHSLISCLLPLFSKRNSAYFYTSVFTFSFQIYISSYTLEQRQLDWTWCVLWVAMVTVTHMTCQVTQTYTSAANLFSWILLHIWEIVFDSLNMWLLQMCVFGCVCFRYSTAWWAV